MNSKNHIINKVFLEAEVSSAEKRAAKAELLKQRFNRSLEKIAFKLNQSYSDSFYRLDNVQVEVHVASDEMPNLSNKIEKEVLAVIKKCIEDPKQTKTTNREFDSTSSEENEKEFEKLSGEEKYEQLFTIFLATGRFPWWANIDTLQELEEEWLATLSFNEWLNLIRPINKEHTVAVERFVRQFPDEVLTDLIKRSPYKDVNDFINQIYEAAVNMDLPFGVAEKLKASLYEVTLENIISEEAEDNVYEVLTMTSLTELQVLVMIPKN